MPKEGPTTTLVEGRQRHRRMEIARKTQQPRRCASNNKLGMHHQPILVLSLNCPWARSSLCLCEESVLIKTSIPCAMGAKAKLFFEAESEIVTRNGKRGESKLFSLIIIKTL